ncbi:Microtubule-nucleating Tub4p (gamma-tubulin) complex component [Tulasnella sp. 330]|nr:Microtubule-nucleating Tub4p (gamma-tubulin) complex component [Tulasnella sp. 330]
MPSNNSLQSLIQSIVPQTRTDEDLRDELFEQCQTILSSHTGSSREGDLAHLGSAMKRQLLQTPSPSPTITAQRFMNLLSRFIEQEAVSRKHSTLLFLHSLSASNSSNAQTFLPNFQQPAPSQAKRPKQNGFLPPASQIKGHDRTGKSKAQILREYRSKTGHPHVSEDLLVRDSLYLLQGISGKYVHLANVPGDASDEKKTLVFKEASNAIIPESTRELIHKLSELGYLYTRVAAFVQAGETNRSMGLIKQSLCHHLQAQLTEYYRIVAVLESQMAQGVAVEDSSSGRSEDRDTGLTLRRLEVWIEEWRLRMRMMSVCVEGCKDTSGGALVSLIHAYTDNGDPFVRQFTDDLLEEVSKPFFGTLHRWIYSGDLHDPFLEFFVGIDPAFEDQQYAAAVNSFDDESKAREGGLSLWQSKYAFRKEMLPRFVGEDFGRKIFSTGKSLNFIRYSCQDSDWISSRNKLDTSGRVLKYSDITGLERSIDTAYQVASQRLYDVLFEKFRLMDHLLALKHYLLLGHGDFAEALLEAMTPYLGKAANNLQRHKLTSSLETAIRATNAQLDPPDVLRRLDARMLEFTHGEIGWDVFTLEYKVDAPIDTVLDPESMRKYLRLFGHLWRMKRVDSALSACWMKITSGSRTFLQLPGDTRYPSSNFQYAKIMQFDGAELEGHWHQARIAISEMIFFVRQLQTYCHSVVIEVLWKKLSEFLTKKEGDLDSLIQAHREYLDRTLTKILLLRHRQGKEEQYLGQVREAFQFALLFIEAIDSLYNHSLNEAARRDTAKDQARGVITTPDNSDNTRRALDSDNLSRILRRIREYSKDFSERALHVAVGVQNHEDGDCKFLGMMLAFSDFYSNKRLKMKGEQAVSVAVSERA